MMKSILTSTVLLAASSLLSKILGVIRTNRFADAFGTSMASDAYFAAFQVPDFMYNLIVYGAISGAFIPILSEYITKKDLKRAWEFSSNVLNILLLLTGVIALILYIFAPYIINILYFGFPLETKLLTAELMRIMLITPLFFSISGVAGSIQNVYHHFVYYSLAPIIYNLFIIFGIVYLAPHYGIHGVAYGVAIGAFFHMAIQLPIIFKKGFRWLGIVDLMRSDFKEIVTLSIPRIFTLGVSQINLIVEGIIASTLAFGSLTIFRYAQDLQYFPIGIIGISFAISSFGIISKLIAKKDYSRAMQVIQDNIHKILFLILPASVGLFVLKAEIVEAILFFGAFSREAAETTALTLGILCVQLFAMSTIPLLIRVFYSFKDTKTPFYIGLITIAINIIAGITLTNYYGIYGLAIANVLAYLTQWLCLVVSLEEKYPLPTILKADKIVGFSLASAIMGAAVWFGKESLLHLHIWLQLAIFIILGAATYFICTWNTKENILLRQKFLPMLFK